MNKLCPLGLLGFEQFCH